MHTLFSIILHLPGVYMTLTIDFHQDFEQKNLQGKYENMAIYNFSLLFLLFKFLFKWNVLTITFSISCPNLNRRKYYVCPRYFYIFIRKNISKANIEANEYKRHKRWTVNDRL